MNSENGGLGNGGNIVQLEIFLVEGTKDFKFCGRLFFWAGQLWAGMNTLFVLRRLIPSLFLRPTLTNTYNEKVLKNSIR
jgi:hypothetical protein